MYGKIHQNTKGLYLLGHSCSLQAIYCLASPVQFDPPFNDSEQNRNRPDSPPPHVTLHSVQPDQRDHCPSTENSNIIENKL